MRTTVRVPGILGGKLEERASNAVVCKKQDQILPMLLNRQTAVLSELLKTIRVTLLSVGIQAALLSYINKPTKPQKVDGIFYIC